MHRAGKADIFATRTAAHLNAACIEVWQYTLNGFNDFIGKLRMCFPHDFDWEIAWKLNQRLLRYGIYHFLSNAIRVTELIV